MDDEPVPIKIQTAREKLSPSKYIYPDENEEQARTSVLELLHQEAKWDLEEPLLRTSPERHKLFIGKSGKGIFALDIYPQLMEISFCPEGQNDIRFEAQLQSDGDLYLNTVLYTADEKRNIIRSERMPHFKDLVEVALNFYQTAGYAVNGIMGAWNRKPYEIGPFHNPIIVPSTNYEEWQKYQSQGLSREEAALLTPTGRIASRNGFNSVKIESMNTDGVTLIFRKNPDPLDIQK